MQGHEVSSTDHHKVPFWVGTDRKIISGISKSTTCEHVIRSLLSKSEDYSKFVIVEKWKKMERRLEPSAKILKVWKAWGDQKNEVALILRHHTSAADGYIDKKISNRVLRRKSSSSHHHHHHQRKNCNEEKNVDSPDKHMTESMERLLKIVLTQGETIQAQLKKLRHQEDQIERFEHHIHQIRSLQDGENYVLDSYLHDEKGKDKRSKNKDKNKRDKSREKSVSTSSRGESSSYSNSIPVQKLKSPPDDPATGSNSDQEVLSLEQSEMIEKICDLNSKLTKEEERLVKLDFKVKKISEKSTNSGTTVSSSEPLDVETHHCPVDTEEVCECDEFYLKVQLLSELETLRELTSDQSKEIELNEKNLTEMDQLLDLKHDELSNLTYQIQLVDEESQVLKSRLLQIGHGFLVHSYSAAADLAEEKARNHNINLPSQSPPEKIISSAPNLNFNLNVQPINYPLMSQASPSPQFKCNQPIQIAPQNVSSLLNNSSEIIVVGPVPVDQSHSHSSITKSISNNNSNNNNSPSKVDHHDNDSNSDTGISSLHSSGDENNFPLDTLV